MQKNLLDFPLPIQGIIFDYLLTGEDICRYVLDIVGNYNFVQVKKWCFQNCPCTIENCFPGIFAAAEKFIQLTYGPGTIAAEKTHNRMWNKSGKWKPNIDRTGKIDSNKRRWVSFLGKMILIAMTTNMTGSM